MHAISCCSDRSDTGFASAARSTPGQSRVLRSGARRHLHVSANTGDGYTPAPTAIIIINCNNSKLTYRQEIALPQPFSLPGNAVEENQKVKTQWPRSADEPGVYMAQTGMGAVG